MVKNKQFYVCTLLALLILVLTGCTQSSSENKNKIVSHYQNENTNVVERKLKNPKKTLNNSSSISSNRKAPFNMKDTERSLETYKMVLLNKIQFFSTDDNRYVHLNSFLNGDPKYPLKVTNFTVLDMDGDKVPEVVLELSIWDWPDFFEVLHYEKGAVYGYKFVYRGLMGLKKDGTFSGSSGAADKEFGKLKFNSNTYEKTILGYSESSNNNGVFTVSYFVNQKTVTEELFLSFFKEQNGKEDVVWYKFSPNIIETQLSIR